MSQTSAPRWCNCTKLAAWRSRSFMALRSRPSPSPWGCTRKVRSELVVGKPEWELIPVQAHVNHQQCISVFPSHTLSFAARKALLCSDVKHAAIHVQNKCDTVVAGSTPSNSRSSVLPWCQKQKTPHALIWSESAERGWCPADLVRVCASGAEQTWKGGGLLETKLNTQETHELSYGLSNFNDIVCEKEGI